MIPKIQTFWDVTLCRLGKQVPTVRMIVMLSSSEPTDPREVLFDQEEDGIATLQSGGYLIPVDKP